VPSAPAAVMSSGSGPARPGAEALSREGRRYFDHKRAGKTTKEAMRCLKHAANRARAARSRRSVDGRGAGTAGAAGRTDRGGHDIPVARVQAMHQGKRRARRMEQGGS
jgi:hypothetical protein